MSDKFYAGRYDSLSTGEHVVIIFSLESKAKDYIIALLENEQAGYKVNESFDLDPSNFVTAFFADRNNLPHHFNDVELVYINNVIPRV